MADLSQPMMEDPAKYYEKLFERLNALRKQETFCDVTVAVKGKEFKAHKVVLAAASPFFLSLWESHMLESNEQLIEIKLEEATASVMEEVLQYIYTGNVSVTEESCNDLVATADYLLLPGLKSLACDFLKKKLAIDNCVFTYYFADRYHCAELKELSCWEINLNFTAVMKTGDFLNLDMNQVMEWVSSDDIKVSYEEEVFDGIVKWVSYNKSERESCFFDLLRQVRLNCVSQDFLQSKLVKEELVTKNDACLNFVLNSIVATHESHFKPPRKCLKHYVEGVFVCGGKMALCYCPDDNKWYWISSMAYEHQNHAVIQYKDKVYIFSKQNVHSIESHVVEYYVPLSNCWGSIQFNSTDFDYEEQFSSVSSLSGCSSLFALTNSTEIPENTIFTYNPAENSWEIKGSTSSRNRWGACAVAVGNHLYIIGGSNCSDTVPSGITKVERFDPREERLEEVASLNEGRHDAFGAAMNDKIYVAGGIQKNDQTLTLLSTCEVYDLSTNEWHLMADLCIPRHSASMVCFKGALYVFGGLKNTRSYLQTRELSVEVFNSETKQWKKKSTIPVCLESDEETNKQIHYKACFATIHHDVLLDRIYL